ncbi:hypothetical protein [Natronomonas gomsonensis]|uniref:hypothetical protein n=1 Tax=Natronomonas gomsonensis TaxID=1046043 RepID=UPI0015B9ACEB|nr:hypothetical protein [Natronomonas gomsonensis]
MTVPACPIGCEEGGPFSTKNGAVMHMINKEDDLHAEVSNKADAYALLEGDGNQETAEDSEGSDESTPEPSPEDTGSVDFPTAPDGPADRDPTEPAEQIQTDTPDDDLDDGGDDDPDPPAGAATAGEGSAAAGLAVGAVAVAGLAFMKLRGQQRGSQTDNGPNYEVV